jgi:hypothetical protein
MMKVREGAVFTLSEGMNPASQRACLKNAVHSPLAKLVMEAVGFTKDHHDAVETQCLAFGLAETRASLTGALGQGPYLGQCAGSMPTSAKHTLNNGVWKSDALK